MDFNKHEEHKKDHDGNHDGMDLFIHLMLAALVAITIYGFVRYLAG